MLTTVILLARPSTRRWLVLAALLTAGSIIAWRLSDRPAPSARHLVLLSDRVLHLDQEDFARLQAAIAADLAVAETDLSQVGPALHYQREPGELPGHALTVPLIPLNDYALHLTPSRPAAWLAEVRQRTLGTCWTASLPGFQRVYILASLTESAWVRLPPGLPIASFSQQNQGFVPMLRSDLIRQNPPADLYLSDSVTFGAPLMAPSTLWELTALLADVNAPAVQLWRLQVGPTLGKIISIQMPKSEAESARHRQPILLQDQPISLSREKNLLLFLAGAQLPAAIMLAPGMHCCPKAVLDDAGIVESDMAKPPR